MKTTSVASSHQDKATPKAEAFAVLGDRFLAVGSTTDIKALAGPKTRIYDAKGAVLKAEMLLNHATLKDSYAGYATSSAS